jgi:diamine N-acetyltransferase
MGIKLDEKKENDGKADVSLREVTAETVRQVCKLSDTLPEAQQRMVAPNAVSIAEAHFSDKAWFRAIYAGEMLVGFIMLYDDPDEHEYFLWRLMIAGPYQGMGYGKRALELLVEYVRTRPGAEALYTSYVPVDGGPEGFYRKFGFEPTGEVDDGELVVRLPL